MHRPRNSHPIRCAGAPLGSSWESLRPATPGRSPPDLNEGQGRPRPPLPAPSGTTARKGCTSALGCP
eukprot:1975231-Pyramimonas_sp.AAC.1